MSEKTENHLADVARAAGLPGKGMANMAALLHEILKSEKPPVAKPRCTKVKGVDRPCVPWKYGCGGNEKKPCPSRKEVE